MLGNVYPKPCERIWAVAYADGKKEYYELHTVNKERESGTLALWHGEYPIGRGITDFLYLDLEELAEHIRQLKDVMSGDYDKDAFLYDMTMWWLHQSPIMAALAAAIQRLHLDGDVADLEKMLDYYKAVQTKLKHVAADCFDLDKQTDMGSRYISKLGEQGNKYPKLVYGPVHFGVTLVNCNLLMPFDRVADYIASDKSKAESFGDYYITEMLNTESAEDLVNFMLSRYLKENIRFRSCKYCGRYFGITGNAIVEYCSRTIEGSTKTCKEMGSVRRYEKRLMEDPVVKEYKRSNKAHNARVRTGRWTKEQFTEWSVEARRRRDECLAGKTTLEEFREWLDSDRIDRSNNMD